MDFGESTSASYDTTISRTAHGFPIYRTLHTHKNSYSIKTTYFPIFKNLIIELQMAREIFITGDLRRKRIRITGNCGTVLLNNHIDFDPNSNKSAIEI
jgi:hypothetical protein